MNAGRDIERLLSDWLVEEAPSGAPDRIVLGASDRIGQTGQRRFRVAWRFPTTNAPLRTAAAAVIGLLLLGAGIYLSGQSDPAIGGPATPSPTASEPPTAQQPSPSLSVEPTPSGRMWPQSTLEEVRAAQDSTDGRHAWQLDANLAAHLAQGGPYGAEIFKRFLQEKLGWESFWARGEEANEGRVVFLRCAPGLTNPLVPPTDDLSACAPTLDESHYETVRITVSQPDRQGPTGLWVVTDWEMLEPYEPMSRALEAEARSLLDGFLKARVAGEGAEQYLDDRGTDIPLLYATSSGAHYDKVEYGRVLGYTWPYGLTAFWVRLFAGETVVEQLVFWSPESHLLRFEPEGFATDIAPTTENGRPVPFRFEDVFDGELTLKVAHPWNSTARAGLLRLIPERPRVAPTTDGGERNDWDTLSISARLYSRASAAPGGTGCTARPAPADAESLATSLASDPSLKATDPVAVSAGGAQAQLMDVAEPGGARVAVQRVCDLGFLQLEFSPGVATGQPERMRLYLFDAPEGASMQILAVAIMAPESHFERAVEAAALIVDSIEFHAP